MKRAILLSCIVVLSLVVVFSSPAGRGKPPSGQSLPWGVDRIDADMAWGVSKGSGVKVAVIDTGIDKNHPDLVGKTNGVNFLGVEFPGNDNYGDTGEHGTALAGVITANDNTIGVVGVVPEVSLYSVRVREKSGTVYPDNYPNHGNTYDFTDLCEGMKWCVAGPDGYLDTGDEPGIQVINFSLGIWTIKINRWGNPERDQPLHDCEFYSWIKEAAARNIVMVAAAGNSARRIEKYNNPPLDADYIDTANVYDFPASYPEIIAVSATGKKGPNDAFASFSNYGPAIELAAPGDAVYTTGLNGGYVTRSGTSLAAPHVVGTAALVLAKYPYLTAVQVREHLQNTAEWLSKLTGEQQGYGLVDAEKAATPSVSPAPSRWRFSPVNKLPVTWGKLKGE